MTSPYRIFISYRRNDVPRTAENIHRYLSEFFSDDEIFLDVRERFNSLQDISTFVRGCDVLLVIIGHRWEQLLMEHTQSPNGEIDYVRAEIETGIQTDGVFVIPVLINDTPMPRFDNLAQAGSYMGGLAYKVGAPVRESDFETDMKALTVRIMERYKRWCGITRVHDGLPTHLFRNWVRRDTRNLVRLMYTYANVLHSEFDFLVDAITQRDIVLQILLLEPESCAAMQRSRDLGSDEREIARGVEGNLHRLAWMARKIGADKQHNLQVRLYDNLPYTSLLQCDAKALIGDYPIGHMANTSPHLEVHDMGNTIYGRYISQQFDTTWSAARSVVLTGSF